MVNVLCDREKLVLLVPVDLRAPRGLVEKLEPQDLLVPLEPRFVFHSAHPQFGFNHLTVIRSDSYTVFVIYQFILCVNRVTLVLTVFQELKDQL